MGAYQCNRPSDSGMRKDATLTLTASESGSVKEKDIPSSLIDSAPSLHPHL